MLEGCWRGTVGYALEGLGCAPSGGMGCAVADAHEAQASGSADERHASKHAPQSRSLRHANRLHIHAHTRIYTYICIYICCSKPHAHATLQPRHTQVHTARDTQSLA